MFLNNQSSFETGLDVGLRKTAITMTYFRQRWDNKKENCPESAGYCVVTNYDLKGITVDGVEIKMGQEITLSETGKISVTAGSSLAWQLQKINNESFTLKNTYTFLNATVILKRFFGSVMVSKEDQYDLWDLNEEVPVPLREVSLGYHLPKIDSKFVKSARFSFNGRNLINKGNPYYEVFIPYRLYSMNLSLKFR